MPKANLKQKRGNHVYHTPINTPASTPRSFRDIKGAIMPHQSQENVDLWWDVFREIGNECRDRTKIKWRKNT